MCLKLITLKNPERQVPCGRCEKCRASRVSAWSFRLMQEEKISISSHFITLTYDTRNVPISPHGYMHLSVRDLQLFIKRLRKAHGKDGQKIKYYAVGEYGGKSWRPHYHIILFNCRIELIPGAWTKIDRASSKMGGSTKQLPPVQRTGRPDIHRQTIGFVHYGQVSGASIGYTLKYISKPARVPQHKNDDRQPEFSLMSKGIGKNYLSQSIINWHKSDLENRMHLNLPEGKKCGMPRYYKDRLYTQEEREAIAARSVVRVSNETQRKYETGKGLTYGEREQAIIASLQRQSTNNTKTKL